MTHLVTLAELDEDKVTPGVLGFIVFAVMALAVWGLMKSMNRHMGKPAADVARDDPADGTGAAAGPVADGAGAFADARVPDRRGRQLICSTA